MIHKETATITFRLFRVRDLLLFYWHPAGDVLLTEDDHDFPEVLGVDPDGRSRFVEFASPAACREAGFRPVPLRWRVVYEPNILKALLHEEGKPGRRRR